MNKYRFIIALLALLLGLVSIVIIPALYTANSDTKQPMDIGALMAGDNDAAFSKAFKPQPFQFPEDHGPHPAYRTEWWYITGNLTNSQQQRYSYQLTFFRRSLAKTTIDNKGWNDPAIYMAHFAVSDHQQQTFDSSEKFGRNGAGVAGAQSKPFKVWIDDWRISSDSADRDIFPLHIRARSPQWTLELTATAAKPLILQGDQGLSQKSAQPGNASYYYSYTRLTSVGTLTRPQQAPIAVTGNSWLDREWSTSALAPQQQGWDWFSLQLHNGDDIMIYQLRNKDGSIDPFSSGVIHTADGQQHTLTHDDITLIPLRYWQHKAHRYPVEWQLDINRPGFKRSWRINAAMDAQLIDHSVRYWEGAITVFDLSNQQVIGEGFMELTGY